MATAPVRRLVNGDMTFGAGLANYATLAEAAAQRVSCNLKLVAGEWFLDTSAGVPWWQLPTTGVQPIMGVPRNLAYVESVLKAAILATDGIDSINTFSMSFDSTKRKLTVSANINSVDGDVADIQVTM